MSPTDILSPEATSELLRLAVVYGTRVIGALGVLVVAWMAARWAARGVAALLERRDMDPTVQSFARSLSFWTTMCVGVAAVMSVFGVETTTIAALIGGAGVGVGLALQGNLANLSSGLLLLAFRPFTAEDWIEVDGVEGRVREVNLFTTSLDTLDNRRVIVPNDKLFGGIVENRDFHAMRRVDIGVGVDYDAQLDEVIEVLTECLEGVDDRVEDRDVMVRCTGFGASSVDFKLGVWARTEDYFDVRHAMHLAVKAALDEAAIGIPYPQRVLHLEEPVRAHLTGTDRLREAS